MEKVLGSIDEAVERITDGATVMVGGFGGAGFPFALRDGLIRRRPRDITIICNNADFVGLAYEGGLKKIICSFPRSSSASLLGEGIEAGRITLELTPQGTLVERIRAGASGLGGVLTPTGIGTQFADAFRTIEIDGRSFLLATPLRADFALVAAEVADSYGNLVMRHAARNFNPIMAMAADVTIVQAKRLVNPGEIDPDHVHVASVFVDWIVAV